VIPLPEGFGVALDPSVRRHDDGRLLVGGAPARTMRLTDEGREAFDRLVEARVESKDARLLARRLVDAGMAHPRPPRAEHELDAMIVVPVRDRPAELDRCLTALGTSAPVVVVDDGSCDTALIASACEHHGARLMRLEPGRGAAAARNAGIEAVDSELVAFVDSDCVAPGGWLSDLAAHFADPLVGAVAPRVVPRQTPGAASARSRFASARSPLDMGGAEAAVAPDGRVPWVPTAALVVRRRALDQPFDPALACGEDVDLVWRLHDAGWRVRYVPEVRVEHEEPTTWSGLLRRRFRYGTSVGPLARRHPGRLSHVVLRPWSTAAGALALFGRPRPALAATAAHAAVLSWRLRGTGVPPARGSQWAAASVGYAVVAAGHAATMLAAPALLGACVPRTTRRAALVLLAAAPLEDWIRRRPPLDPLRWAAACIADDVAYGAGVWRSCLVERAFEPLLPTTTPPAGDRRGVRTGPVVRRAPIV
jgi:mycofactocin system glycosyltransferase